ncbi:MAG: hypothetical protein AAGH15_24020 [Myxococcota bacterium]
MDDALPPESTLPTESEGANPTGAEALEAAWAEVLSHWDDPGPHERYLALAEALGRQADAGARYRAVREAEPERAAEAKRRIDQLVARALVRLHATRTPPRTSSRRWLFLVAMLVALALLGTAAAVVLGG